MIVCGLDVETTALSPREGRLRTIQFANQGGGVYIIDVDKEPPEQVARYFRAMKVKPVAAHNANFEEMWAREYGVALHLHDTMVMSQVLYGGTEGFRSRKHSLAAVVYDVLGEELSKEQQTSDWTGVLTEEQIEYAKKDAAILVRLFPALKRKLDDERLLDVYRLENNVRPAIAAMERVGVAVHRGKLKDLIHDYTVRTAQLRSELEGEWGINPGSSKQLRKYFALDVMPNWPKTPAGAASTNQEAMKALRDKHPSVEKWLQWKEAEKIRSTYGTSIMEKLSQDERIHARFNAFGTATGRFSSSGPNLQNIPKRGERGKQMRGLFWSGSKDRVLIKADYESIELWIAAYLWGDPAMQQALRKGVNMHVRTAAALFEKPAEEVTKEEKATGKIVNFALLYGGSPNRIMQEYKKNGIPIDEDGAKAVHKKFFDTYTGFAARKALIWANYDKNAREKNDTVVRTPIGRARSYADWYGPLMNHEIQGTGADGVKFALALMYEDRMDDVYPVLTVHDEIVVDAPKSKEEEVKAWVKAHMVRGMLRAVNADEKDVPSMPSVEIETGREWS
jgi:DNA polymerase-1